MSTECDQQFAGTCRACTYKQEYDNVKHNAAQNQMHSIYECVVNNESTRIVDILNSTTPQLHIVEMDALPKTVCDNCLQQLLLLHQFQQMCVRSDQEMRKLLEVKLTPLHESKPPLSEDPLDKSFLKLELAEENWEPMAVVPSAADTIVKTELDNAADIANESTESNKPTKPTKRLRQLSKCKQKLAQTQIKQDRFGKRVSLRSQKTRQTSIKHICKLCKEKFSTLQSLSEHKRNVHADENRSDAEGAITKQSSGLHKSYVCEYCQKCKTIQKSYKIN